MQISGKTAIVTGSGRGIGRATALELGKHGANVVCTARTVDAINETAGLIQTEGGKAVAVQTDIASEESVENLMHKTAETYDGLDILVNNAGSFAAIGAVWEVDAEMWWRDVTVNLKGTMLCIKHAVPLMKKNPENIIINMSGGNQIPGGTGYSCSKLGVIRLTELTAKEFEREKLPIITCVTGPGFVHTQMTDLQITTPEGQKWLASSKDAINSGRDRSPFDCAGKIVEIIEKACPAINGKNIPVNAELDSLIK